MCISQLWHRDNGDSGSSPPCKVIRLLQGLSTELGMMGNLNVSRMKMNIDRMQVLVAWNTH
jgi:hypothetical protein